MISILEFNQLLKKDFAKNIRTLFTGSSISVGVSLISIPILTRLYTPSEFGGVAFYIALAQLVGVFVSGKFDFALMAPRKQGDALRVALGGVIFSFYMAALVAVLVYFFYDQLVLLFPTPFLAELVWALPVLGFVLAVRQLLVMWFSRRSKYRVVANDKIVDAVVVNGARMPRDIFASGVAGLWLSFVVAELAALLAMLVSFFKHDFKLLRAVKLSELRPALVKNASYPTYSMPLAFLNVVSSNLLIFTLTFISSAAVVGIYERFARLVSIPLDTLGGSLGILYHKKHTGSRHPGAVYLGSYGGALLLGTLFFMPLIVWGPSVMAFVLGADWSFAGEIARYLAPLIILGFATRCVGASLATFKGKGVVLIWQLAYLVATVGWIAYASSGSIAYIVKIYALIGSALYLVLGAYGYFLVVGSSKGSKS